MELLVCSRVTSRLYAKIPAKRAEERKALDRSSHIRHTSTVFTVFKIVHILVFILGHILVFIKTTKSVQGTRSGDRHIAVSYSRVELWKEREKEECERKTLKGLPQKNL